jgi:hypothetical protein
MQAKISSEYFPIQTGAKRKSQRCVVPLPRSTLNTLYFGRRPFIIADVMLYIYRNCAGFLSRKHHQTGTFIRHAQLFRASNRLYDGNGILNEFKIRIDAIHQETIVQNWKNEQNFNAIIEI